MKLPTLGLSLLIILYNSICHGPMTSSSRDIPSLVTEDLSMIGSVGRSGMPVGSHEETDGWLNQSMDKLKIMAHNSQRHHGSPSSSRSSIAESNDSLTDRSDSFFTINDCSLSTNDLQHVGGPTVKDTSKSVQSSPLHKLLVKAKMSHTIGNANSEPPTSSQSPQPAKKSSMSSTDPQPQSDSASTSSAPTTSRISKFFPKVSPGQTPVQSADHPSSKTTPASQNLRVQEDNMKKVNSESSFMDLILDMARGPQQPEAEPPKRSAMIRFLSRTRTKPVPVEVPDDEYLVGAAQFISNAQKAETEGSYELAFTCYKSAVNLLLQGVQQEQDVGRRNAVRKKTAKYLLKAERLYKTHLAFDSGTFDKEQWTASAPAVQDPTLIAFQGEKNELKRLQPVAPLLNPSGPRTPTIQLVRDTATDQHYVLKILDKTCHFRMQTAANFISQTSENFVPMQIPRMAGLVKVSE